MVKRLSTKPRKPVIMRYNGLDALNPWAYDPAKNIYMAGAVIISILLLLVFFVAVVQR